MSWFDYLILCGGMTFVVLVVMNLAQVWSSYYDAAMGIGVPLIFGFAFSAIVFIAVVITEPGFY